MSPFQSKNQSQLEGHRILEVVDAMAEAIPRSLPPPLLFHLGLDYATKVCRVEHHYFCFMQTRFMLSKLIVGQMARVPQAHSLFNIATVVGCELCGTLGVNALLSAACATGLRACHFAVAICFQFLESSKG